MHRRDFSCLLAGGALGSAILPALPSLAASTEAQASFRLSVMLWTIYRRTEDGARVDSERGHHGSWQRRSQVP